MAKEAPTQMTRECAWTGEEFTGKGYIVTTTEGTEVVSAAAFLAPWDNAAAADAKAAAAPADGTDGHAPADTPPAA